MTIIEAYLLCQKIQKEPIFLSKNSSSFSVAEISESFAQGNKMFFFNNINSMFNIRGFGEDVFLENNNGSLLFFSHVFTHFSTLQRIKWCANTDFFFHKQIKDVPYNFPKIWQFYMEKPPILQNLFLKKERKKSIISISKVNGSFIS